MVASSSNLYVYPRGQPLKATPQKNGDSRVRSNNRKDLVGLYLQDIGRIDLLSHEEELILARLVQKRERLLQEEKVLAASHIAIKDLVELEEIQKREANHYCHLPTKQEWAQAAGLQVTELDEKLNAGFQAWGELTGLEPNKLKKALHEGRRAKDQMIQANLRLVVAVAKKYQQRGMELLDLVQEGTLGLERAVEKFDPTRGFRFSTYAYWWIRQSMTRAIATQSRNIRLPVHITEKLNRIKRVQQEIASNKGRIASIKDLAQELKLSEETIRQTLMRVPRSISLDTKIGSEQGTMLVDLLEDGSTTPEEKLNQTQLHEDLEILLNELTPREAEVLRLRFGLEDDIPRTLTQIGEELHLSRERIRQIELNALIKLRQPNQRCKVREYIQSLDS